jgi:rhodanese-related sulfurtransferase
MTAIEATNRGAADIPWAMLTSTPHVEEVEADALEAMGPGPLVLDVREPSEFAQGHVPDAVNVPQSDIASRLDELPRDRPIVTICQSGMRSLRAAQFLKQQGFERVASVRGGTVAWRAAGKPTVDDPTASAGAREYTESPWAHAGAVGA